MKAFLIQSPCYKANGKSGTYYSIAFTDVNGNVLKGFGDHISEAEFGIKNVFEAQGQFFSDEDRIISIKEISISEVKFDSFIRSFEINRAEWDKRNREELELFSHDPYHWVYGKKEGQEERIAIRDKWKRENPIPHFNYYGFLDLIE